MGIRVAQHRRRSGIAAGCKFTSASCLSCLSLVRCGLQVHQILKQIVTMAINHADVRDITRFFNLKAEIVANAAGTLGEPRSWLRFWLCLQDLWDASSQTPAPRASSAAEHG